MAKYHDIIFDLDGTLVDSLDGIEHSYRHAIRLNLVAQDVPDIRSYIGPPIRDIFRLSLNLTDKIILDKLERSFRVNYDSIGYKLSPLYPRVVEVLDELLAKNIVCHILTNKPKAATDAILNNHQLVKYFKNIISRENHSQIFKNKIEAARFLSGKIDTAQHQVVVVGDSLDDAESAKVCGYGFLAAIYGYGAIDTKIAIAEESRLINFGSILRHF